MLGTYHLSKVLSIIIVDLDFSSVLLLLLCFFSTGKSAMSRLLGIVHMNPEVDSSTWDHIEEDIYGLGGVRTPEQFYEIFGIDVVKKTTQGHLCQFVDSGKMHKSFTPKLRSDGMGIDYFHIHYKWVDPMPNDKSLGA